MATKTKTAATKTKELVGPDPTSIRLLTVPVADINPATDNLRRDLGDLAELAASIRSIGVLEPLLIIPPGDGVNGYRLVAGHRRLAAAKLAGVEHVPCMVRHDFDDARRQEAMIVENLLRRDLDPIEEAEGYERLVALGMTQRVIADKVGFAQSHIAKRLALRKLTDAAQAALSAGNINIVIAQELAVSGDAVQAEIAKQLTKGKSITQRSIDEVKRGLATKEAIATGEASGLPKWDQQRDGYSYDRLEDRTGATHWMVFYNAIVWVKGTPRAAQKPATSPGLTAKEAKAAEKARLEAERAQAEQFARRADRLHLAGMHLDVFLDVATDAILTNDFSIDEGVDSEDILRWILFDLLDVTVSRPADGIDPDDVDDYGYLADAWHAQKQSTNTKARRRCFIATVVALVEDNLTSHYVNFNYVGLYIRTLNSFGYTPSIAESKHLVNWANARGDSAGINADDLTNSTIDKPHLPGAGVQAELQPAVPSR